MRAEAEEYRQLHDDRVLVFTTFSARGKASGVQIGHRGAEVFEIHDHKVIKIIVYMDRDRAHADLGLAE